MPTNISDFAKFISFLDVLQDLSDDDFDAVVDFAKTLRLAADKVGKKASSSRSNTDDTDFVFPPLKRTPFGTGTKVNSRGPDKRLRGVQMTVDDFLD